MKLLKTTGLALAALMLTTAGVAMAEPAMVAGPAEEAECYVPWDADTAFFQYPAKTGPFRVAGLALLLAWCVTSLFSSHFRTFNEGHMIMLFLGVLGVVVGGLATIWGAIFGAIFIQFILPAPRPASAGRAACARAPAACAGSRRANRWPPCA